MNRPNYIDFEITEHVSQNLKEVLNDKVKKAELEERIKASFFQEFNGFDVDKYDVRLGFNKMSGCFEISIVEVC